MNLDAQSQKLEKSKRKAPSWIHRPWFGKKVLEVGAGQLPYQGVTHIVDKYPQSNEQRGEDLWVPQGVRFFQGELEELPFQSGEKFDYFYARHVFEHVLDPQKSVNEINRVATKGYIETPSPFYEMICCGFPFNPKEMHTLFVWSEQSKNELHVIKKTSKSIEDFCNCSNGQLVKKITQFKRSNPSRIQDSWFPNRAKTTRLFFKGPIRLKIYSDFSSPCKQGQCAFKSIRWALFWSSWPMILTSDKWRNLRRFLSDIDK